MTSNNRIVFIGGGNMAAALMGGLLNDGWSPADLAVVEPSSDQRGRILQATGVTALPAADSSVRNATVVIWAVKPQVMRQAVEATLPYTSNALHVSIAAGVTLLDLASWLKSDRIV